MPKAWGRYKPGGPEEKLFFKNRLSVRRDGLSYPCPTRTGRLGGCWRSKSCVFAAPAEFFFDGSAWQKRVSRFSYSPCKSCSIISNATRPALWPSCANSSAFPASPRKRNTNWICAPAPDGSQTIAGKLALKQKSARPPAIHRCRQNAAQKKYPQATLHGLWAL